MAHLEHSRSTTINIDPNGKIAWEAFGAAIDSSRGTLYVPPDSPHEQNLEFLDMFHDVHHIEKIQMARIYADQEELTETSPYRELDRGRGAHGTVYDADPYAIKAFVPTRHHGHLPEVRATILLEEGLRRIPQAHELPIQHFIMRGVKLLAAYAPSERGGAPYMWAMEKITPVPESEKYFPKFYEFDDYPDTPRIPDETTRFHLYMAALKLFDAARCVKFDDKHDNLLIERAPDPIDGSLGSVVKIDVQTYPGELAGY